MSTIVTENLKRSSETASRSLRGVAAAWVNFNGTGTVAIRDSQNVASITDNGVGDYSQNLTSAMNGTDYGFLATGDGGAGPIAFSLDTVTARTTTLCRMRTANTSGTNADNTVNTTAAHGDLA